MEPPWPCCSFFIRRSNGPAPFSCVEWPPTTITPSAHSTPRQSSFSAASRTRSFKPTRSRNSPPSSRESGAEVTLHWEETGHNISQGDLLMAFRLAAPFLSPSPPRHRFTVNSSSRYQLGYSTQIAAPEHFPARLRGAPHHATRRKDRIVPGSALVRARTCLDQRHPPATLPRTRPHLLRTGAPPNGVQRELTHLHWNASLDDAPATYSPRLAPRKFPRTPPSLSPPTLIPSLLPAARTTFPTRPMAGSPVPVLPITVPVSPRC